MLNPTRAPDHIQSDFSVVTINCTQAPQCVVEAIQLKDCDYRQLLIVRLGLAEMTQQLAPAIGARVVCADCV
jgi:hypothetical protein